MPQTHKSALVTGGSKGIGRAVCIDLATRGYHVLINFSSNQNPALQTLTEIEEIGGSGALLKFDVSNREETRRILAEWMESNPEKPIDVLVNNAGIKKDNLLIWMKDAEWDEVLSVSLNGFYNVTKAVVDGMVRRKFGRIVNVVSLSGLKGLPGQTNYSSSRAALIGATKALSQEVARRNITVNAVAPGFIATDMTEEIDESAYKSLIPMQRFGKPEEVASVVGFLVSSDASYITGEVISVTGGLH